MTKRMIDADELLEWIDRQATKNYAKTFNSFFTSADFIKQEITRLKSLATPQPQRTCRELAEKDAEKDLWCYDMEKAPECCSILIYSDDGCIYVGYRKNKKFFIYYGMQDMEDYNPFAWMPIPEPKDKNND